jgi:hypothetical protein
MSNQINDDIDIYSPEFKSNYSLQKRNLKKLKINRLLSLIYKYGDSIDLKGKTYIIEKKDDEYSINPSLIKDKIIDLIILISKGQINTIYRSTYNVNEEIQNNQNNRENNKPNIASRLKKMSQFNEEKRQQIRSYPQHLRLSALATQTRNKQKKQNTVTTLFNSLGMNTIGQIGKHLPNENINSLKKSLTKPHLIDTTKILELKRDELIDSIKDEPILSLKDFSLSLNSIIDMNYRHKMTAEYIIYLLHTDNNGFIKETENIPLKEVNTINNPNTDNINVLIRKINSDTKALYDFNQVIRKISIILEKKTYKLYGEYQYQFKILLFCGKGLFVLNKPTKTIIGDYHGRENIKQKLIMDRNDNTGTNLGKFILGDL